MRSFCHLLPPKWLLLMTNTRLGLWLDLVRDRMPVIPSALDLLSPERQHLEGMWQCILCPRLVNPPCSSCRQSLLHHSHPIAPPGTTFPKPPPASDNCGVLGIFRQVMTPPSSQVMMPVMIAEMVLSRSGSMATSVTAVTT